MTKLIFRYFIWAANLQAPLSIPLLMLSILVFVASLILLLVLIIWAGGSLVGLLFPYLDLVALFIAGIILMFILWMFAAAIREDFSKGKSL